ncbi:hypothetical protein ACWOAH_05120 [Vagococcus vulneris]|uniref:Cardiolipin synthase N-terminal domain-containing protein n=1 Tax=Vagococcus vulneris TaxID=1977869 RepID=A0A429ZZT7_9ENTE|nr:hypothetical protein [Vagococcus vulneris]RST99544.1 hypothetical protein CBF37_04245 [Vagococcus vulneris]
MDISDSGYVGLSILVVIWSIITGIQAILSYGTAYRYTKRGGDNGVALFGWFIVFQLASYIPFLGYYFWKKSKK